MYTDAIHYAFWLGIVPDESTRGQGTLTFAQTLRALRRDFGAALPPICAACVAFPLLALFGCPNVRGLYFALSGFHGYVEGALLVFLWVRGPLGPHTGPSGADRGPAALSFSCARKLE